MSESTKSVTTNGEYLLYTNGKVIGQSPIIFIGKARVAKIYETKIKALLDAAAKDNIPIKINSSLRTWDEQIVLRKQNLKDKTKINDVDFLTNAPSNEFSPLTGKPGFSNHQNGRAFDFNTINPIVYKWLVKNGISFNFIRTVKSERWHWEYLEKTDQFKFVPKTDPTWDKLV
jgi:LAS superfamily LD-carboxypeptidase LdcB